MILRIAAKQLSLGNEGDDVERVHGAIRELGRAVPVDERTARVFGPATAATVRALQAELGVEATSVLDERTVAAINTALEGAATAERVVRGSVTDESGRPFKPGFVEVLLQRPTGNVTVGKAELDDTGRYDVRYKLPREHVGVVDLRVVVADRSGPLQTMPTGASVVADAAALEVIDFALARGEHRAKSEVDVMVADLEPLIAGRALADLEESEGKHEISMLASQSGYATAQVAALVRAHQLARETGVPAAVYHGLLRNGLPTTTAALLATQPEQRSRALKAAVAAELVPEKIDGKRIEEFLPDVRPTSSGVELEALLGDQLEAADRASFVAEYFKRSDDPDGFWKAIAENDRFRSRADRLKLTVQIGVLTNNHVPLVKALLALPEIRQAKDLVRVTEAGWKTLVKTGVGVPAGTPGANENEQIDAYVEQIVTQVEAAFPTAFFAARLGNSPVARFLDEHPTYDLEKTYPDRFLKDNAGADRLLTQEARRDLDAFQRLYRLTSRATETLALANQELRSSLQIARLDRDVFAARMTDTVPAARAHEIHANATRAAGVAIALFGEYSAKLDRAGLQALPRTDLAKRAALASEAIPNWETLFGTFDLCACQECNAAHGAAAYLVDILQFLRERGVKDALFARRPDIGEIELSCENTNTLLPTIDLVNEVLENAVTPPPPFTPLTLPTAREADLDEPIATPELRAAFDPPLVEGARIESIEPGKRWRICDEAFAYTIVKTVTAVDVTTRSRQTSGTSLERHAAPQYINRAAYGALADAVYPWTLPFDLSNAEANVFLTHLGVSRRDVIETLRDMQEPFDPDSAVSLRMAAERLGLTNAQRKIIVGEPLPPAHAAEEFWGGATPASLTTVRDVLDRSGLSFAELDQLVATRFVDPSDNVRIRAKANERVDTCDPTKLEIDGLTAAVLDRMHRFVRLQRAVGWSIPDLDRAIAALSEGSGAPQLNNRLLVRLDHLRALSTTLRLSVPETLALWKPIDTAGPDSIYQHLFFNPVVYRPQDEAFRLRKDGTELVHATELATTHSAVLQTVFRLTPESVALLVQPDDRLTLATLSQIYRHTILARALGLSVVELSIAIDLTQLAPFDVQRPDEALRFIEAVNGVRAAGFTFSQLDYLLHHRATDASSLAPLETEQLQTLSDLRDELGAADAATAPETVVRDRMAAALGVTAELAAGVLARVHGGQTAERLLLDIAAVTGALSKANAGVQLGVLEKLEKVATILQAIDVPDSQLEWLFRENPWLATVPDVPAQAAPFASWSSLLDLGRLRRELALQAGALEAILGALTGVATASAANRLAARNTLIAVLVQWLDWSAAELEVLLGKANDSDDRGLLDAHVPDDYRVSLLVRVGRAMKMLGRLGLSARAVDAWCEDVLTANDAKAIRIAAKAKHDDEEWLRLAPQLQNSLRDAQRAALVDYLVARPSLWTSSNTTTDAGDLLAHFLADVEMTACQQSSRIKQAISSVQLFAQRALLGLEPGVSTADARWEQWSWMKSFRIWEANRKIWLYPENFIEAELRDDKTPQFKELEDELLQSELDDAAAEKAVHRYLEKLDELARLEVVGVYEDEDHVLHVFAEPITHRSSSTTGDAPGPRGRHGTESRSMSRETT